MKKYTRPKCRVEWTPPATNERMTFATTARDTPNSVMQSLSQLGCFKAVGAETPKEELSALLEVAAEVEHALLLQYLFAAYTIDPDAVDDSALAKRKILTIAIQEMAHLITIQNLILAIDGPTAFHIGRETIRIDNKLNPLPFLLEAVSRLSLAEYILAEMPAKFPPGNEAIKQQVEELKQEVFNKTGLTPHRVGALYAKIYWIIQPTDEPFGPLALQVDSTLDFNAGWHLKPTDFSDAQIIQEHQATPGEWNPNSRPQLRILQITNAQTAVEAVNKVMSQGEGLGQEANSHFNEFLATLDLFQAKGVTVLPIASNPYVGHLPSGIVTGSPLTHKYVRLWANLLNLRYSALMLHIGHAMSLKTSDEARSKLVDIAFETMHQLDPIMTQMNSNTMRTFDPNSAPTFELLQENLPNTPRRRWLRQRHFIKLETAITKEINAQPELIADITGKLLLDNLSGTRELWKPVVDTQLKL